MKVSSTPTWMLFSLVILGVMCGLVWVNYQFVLHNPGGIDFLVPWVGMRAFIYQGNSPYSADVARDIQVEVYGRPAREGENELFVPYPLYSGLIFAPFALINDYQIARTAWMVTMEVIIVVLAILSMRLIEWQPKLWLFGLFILFSLCWYHSIRTLINGNVVMFVALFIVGTLLAIQKGRDELAGVLLAFMTIKSNVVVVFIVFVIIWSISKQRWRIIGWTLVSGLILILFGMLFIPDWLIQNILEVLRYPGYNPPGTVGAAFFEWWPGIAQQLTIGFTLLVGLILVIEWRSAWGKESDWFLWTASLTLVLSQWIGIQTDPGNFIIMFPALVLVLGTLEKRWGKVGSLLIVVLLIVLFVGLWVLFLSTVEYGDQPQQHAIMLFALPILLLIGLYWVRWWTIRSSRVWTDISLNPDN